MKKKTLFELTNDILINKLGKREGVQSRQIVALIEAIEIYLKKPKKEKPEDKYKVSTGFVLER